MKLAIFVLWLVFCAASAFCSPEARKLAWQPSPGHRQIPIWPGAVPNARPITGPETFGLTGKKDLVAGRPWTYINTVSHPTMTVYQPKGKNTGAAVVIFPGGGYQCLAIDLEGTEVCDWLTARGVTCILLKYRVPGSGKLPKSGPYPRSPEALEDAQRTVGLVRFHAVRWHIDPHKIGVLGVLGRRASRSSHEYALQQAFVSGGGRRRQGKLPPGFCRGSLSGTSRACREQRRAEPGH